MRKEHWKRKKLLQKKTEALHFSSMKGNTIIEINTQNNLLNYSQLQKSLALKTF